MPALKQAKELGEPVVAMPETLATILQPIMEQIRALNDRATRIETLIRDEIRDLKAEQLADIKALIERIDKNADENIKRIADDQRRLWDGVRALERDRDLKAEQVADIKKLADRVDTLERTRDSGHGAIKAIHYVIVTAATAFGAAAAAVVTRLWK